MIKKILSILLFLMFVAFAAVQLNDPDPYLWIPIYLIYAGLSLSAIIKPINQIWHLFFFIAALVGAFFCMPNQWEGIGSTMMNENTEKARETLGLVICAISSLVSGKLS
jgi:hypothetical protein